MSDPNTVGLNTEYETHVQAVAGPKCDDCRKTYDAPPYYTFDPDDCLKDEDNAQEGGSTSTYHADDLPGDDNGCTGNLCPACADELMPDDPTDPRRPFDVSNPF